MRLGIHLPQFRDPVPMDGLVAFARAAEEAGADDLWVSDHVILPAGSTVPPEHFHDALTLLTVAAAATSRVGLGTSVLVAPYRHPVLLAKSVASLDAMSGGRVILGLGSGWMESEFRALGADFARRGALTDDAIRVARALWRGERDVTPRAGGHARGLTVRPGPVRDGGPPVWIGGNSDAAIARAVALGDAWHTTISDEVRLPERIGELTRVLASTRRARADFTVSVRVRADIERLRRVAPRLRDLGVDHVLVDCPDEDVATTRDRVARIRDMVRG